MGIFVSQVKLPNSNKLYWFTSATKPVVNEPCVAWVRGHQKEKGFVQSARYAKNEYDVQQITGREPKELAPLVSYMQYGENGTIWKSIGTIRVNKSYLNAPPTTEKIADYYKRIIHKGERPAIIINGRTGALVDNYCAFLVYRMMHIPLVPCVCVNCSLEERYGDEWQEAII